MRGKRYPEGFKIQAVRQVVDKGFTMTDLVLVALLMAVWRRKPRQKVLVHSDQGVQYTSND